VENDLLLLTATCAKMTVRGGFTAIKTLDLTTQIFLGGLLDIAILLNNRKANIIINRNTPYTAIFTRNCEDSQK
jgi:hypothetical protein